MIELVSILTVPVPYRNSKRCSGRLQLAGSQTQVAIAGMRTDFLIFLKDHRRSLVDILEGEGPFFKNVSTQNSHSGLYCLFSINALC